MRTIQISTSVFAAIWAARQEGEDSEDAILARVLSLPAPREELVSPAPRQGRPMLHGFHDDRFGFHVDEGFEIFRRFKGVEYRARATGQQWLLESTGKKHFSLSELSTAIGAPGENAWGAWYFRVDGGAPQRIGSLRDPATVQKRGRRPTMTIELLRDTLSPSRVPA